MLPVVRSRLMLWAWKPGRIDLAQLLAAEVQSSRVTIPNQCPFARGFLWLGSGDPGLRLHPASLSMYEHPDLRPWSGYRRVIAPGRPVGVIMRTYGKAHNIDQQHLLARSLHGQFVEDGGLRLLHPSECRVLMALPPFSS